MITDGDSAYNRRHKKGHFKGELLMFGCAVGYMPTPQQSAKEPLYQPTAKRGIFVGYYVHPGGIWKKEYQVIDLDQAQCNLHLYCSHKIKITRTLEIVVPLSEDI